MSNYRKFSADFKFQVVLSVLTAENTLAEVCRRHSLSETLFYLWKAEFLAGASRIFESDPQLLLAAARIAELERLVGRLTLEAEISKKVLTGLASPTSRNGASR